METYCCYTDDPKGRAEFSSDEKKMINLIRRLQAKYPDLVEIMAEPEKNDGCIYCHIPSEWFTISVPRKLNLTDEQREMHRNIMKRVNERRG